MLSENTIKNTLMLVLSGAAEKKNEDEIWVNMGIMKKHITIQLLEANDNGDSKLIARSYYANGQQRYEAHYVNYKRHGSYREWTPKGHLWITGTYKNGKRHGTFVNHWQNREVIYNKGKAKVEKKLLMRFHNKDLIKDIMSPEEEMIRTKLGLFDHY